MRVIRLTTPLLALLAVTAAPLLAQNGEAPPRGLEIVPPHSPRDGFWANFGLGVGWETFSAPGATVDPGWLARPTIDMRVGGTPSGNVRLGAEFVSWFNSEMNISQSLGGLAGIVQLYPSRTAGFFLKGGGGYAWNSFSDNYYYYGWGYITYDAGFMWTAGAGWELPISKSLNIVPTVDCYAFDFGGRTTADYSEQLWNVGVAIQIP